MVIPADILAGFFAVLILNGLIKRNTASILSGQCQKLCCGFLGTTVFLGIFLDCRLFRLTGLIVEPCNPSHSLVLIHIFKGTGLLLHPTGQKSISDKMMGIGQKIRPLCWIVLPETIQHGKYTAHFVVQKAFRVIAIQPLPQQETANTTIKPVFIAVQKKGEPAQFTAPHSLNDIIIQIFMDRRFGVKLKDAFHFPHGHAPGFRQKAVFGTVAGQLPCPRCIHFPSPPFGCFSAYFFCTAFKSASWIISCS